MQLKHEATKRELMDHSKTLAKQAQEEMLKSKREMEEMIQKMKEDFERKERQQEEEKEVRTYWSRRTSPVTIMKRQPKLSKPPPISYDSLCSSQLLRKEAEEKMKLMEHAAGEAKKAAEEASKHVKEKREQALLKALQKRATSAGGGGVEVKAQALKAYKAAQARAAMTPEQRARAIRRWKNAASRVLSPAQKIKRAMREFATTKVNKNQTVVSRVEKLEEENKEYERRIHQLEKQVKKMMAKQLKDAALEYKLHKQVQGECH